MSETFPTGRYTSTAVSATAPTSYTDGTNGIRDSLQAAGSAHIWLNGAGIAAFEVTAVSGLTGTVEVITQEGGTWRQWDGYQKAAGAASVLRTAGTTVTFVSGDIIIVPALEPFLAVRIKRAGGTSATFAIRTGADAVAFLAYMENTSGNVFSSAPTEVTPNVASGSSVTLLAANANRKYLLVYNGTGANIMFSLGGLTLTGIVPTATNIGEVLVPGQYYENPAHFCSTTAITVYQTSGATVNTIVAVSA